MVRLDRRQLISHGTCLALGAGLGAWALRPGAPGGTARVQADDRKETAEQRLAKLGLELPKVATPKVPILPAVKVGNLLYVSGHTPPPRDGKPVVGKVGKDATLEDARKAAHDIGRLILAVVRQQLGTLNDVVRLVKTLGMVNCTPEFTQQPQVINAFSELMIQVFGEVAGKAARSAVGMASLPGGVPVEIECIFQVKE
jgi:enamine deaminase RidA (YjgF/YER057c/UK114 family)